jgi:uncharacterized protein (TIGR03084 family)
VSDRQDHDFVDVLDAEHADLEIVLSGLSRRQWEFETPAVGWTVKDSVSHLADTELIARHTVTGGPRALAHEIGRTNGAVIESGVDAGRLMSGDAVRAWFRATSEYNRAALRRVDTTLRVPWGLGMGWRTFVTARLMEAWAHGLDIRAALGRPARDTDRLQHVAWLSLSSLPYAFRFARLDMPTERSLRLELEGPEGENWIIGPDDATDTIRGPAGVWCRRAVQRIPPDQASDLELNGPLAELAFANARCFL